MKKGTFLSNITMGSVPPPDADFFWIISCLVESAIYNSPKSQEPSFREGIDFLVLLPCKFGRSKNRFVTVTKQSEFGFRQSRQGAK